MSLWSTDGFTHGERKAQRSQERCKQRTSLNATAGDELLPPGIRVAGRVWKELRVLVQWAAGVKTPHQSSRTLLLLHLLRAMKKSRGARGSERQRVGLCFFWLIVALWPTHGCFTICSSNACLRNYDPCCPACILYLSQGTNFLLIFLWQIPHKIRLFSFCGGNVVVLFCNLSI